jgi:hypothetical protein
MLSAVGLAPKWTPRGVAQRARNIFRQPGDVALTVRIGWCLWRLPRRLERGELPALLADLRAAPRPAAADPAAAGQRIARLRQQWWRLPAFRRRNTCYMRALVLYRFLDPGTRPMRIHFGVTPGADPLDRLHGHAWVTVDGEIFEAPAPVLAGNVREIYRHPADDPAPRPHV